MFIFLSKFTLLKRNIVFFESLNAFLFITIPVELLKSFGSNVAVFDNAVFLLKYL